MKKKGNQKKGKDVNSGLHHVKNKYEQTNPFELRINRVKHNVLGQKIKSGVGNPGASRNRINKIRLKSFKKISELRSKSNIFVDKRIGEYDNSVSQEDRVNARIVHARKKRCKKDIFNLNDDEHLTHLGEEILNLEEYGKPESDSDEEDNVQLNADFVDKVHFGGFLTKKVQNDVPKTHREIMGNIILDSKQRKEERKAEKRVTDELGERLDKQWKEMQPVITQMKRKMEDPAPSKESYDLIVRQLQFEPRGTAAKPLKTNEQIEKEEAEKQKKMEEERRLRMMNPDHLKKKKAVSELSVDRLDYYDGWESLNAKKQPNDVESEHSDFDGDEQSGILNMEHDGESESPESVKRLLDVPKTVKELAALIKNYSAADACEKLKAIADSLHPSLRAGNKTRLEDFFLLIIKYLCTYRKEFIDVDLLDSLVPQLYEFAQLSPLKLGTCFREILKDKYTSYQKKTLSNTSPSYDILITLKLCRILFSTSDYHHPVATPAMLLISDILSKPYTITPYTILARLFLSNLFFEYLAYSKRLATEPIMFLQDVFFMASSEQLLEKFNPRHTLLQKKNYLFVDSEVKEDPSSISLKIFKPANSLQCTNDLKVSIIFCASKVLHKFATFYKDELMFSEIFSPFVLLSNCLPITAFPPKLVETVSSFKSAIAEHSTSLNYLIFPSKKPPMLKMLEPKFEMNFSAVKKVKSENKLRVEKELQQKIRKEERGLIREMRREAQFIAGEQLKTQRLADEERKMKVRKLCHELSIQEGEFKKLCKKK